LDEVYCGTGTSGKIYCCDWDKVKPDFIFMGKTLAAGYGALSVVVTSSKIEDIIKKGQGRLQHTTTHQAHSLAVAAALAVQKIIHNDDFLENVEKTGSYMRTTLFNELHNSESFRDVRGRGMRFSLEYSTKDNVVFSSNIEKALRNNHNILINAKWHRICFTPSLLLTKSEVDYILESVIKEFRNLNNN
jgi:adenosylmethionine-8-amino-7-oxononanoate aminotransferase